MAESKASTTSRNRVRLELDVHITVGGSMAEFGSMEEFGAALNRLYKSTVALQERQEETDRQLSQVVSSLAALVRIAEGHERRLDRLEGQ
jgi:hypothetical protein